MYINYMYIPVYTQSLSISAVFDRYAFLLQSRYSKKWLQEKVLFEW